MLPQSVHAENTMFTTTRLQDWASTAIRYGEAFGFNIAGLIMPSFNDDKQTAIFGYEPYAITASKFGERNLPGALRPNGKVKDWDADHEVRREALYGAILKASAEHGDNVTSDECYISEDNQISDPINPVRPLWQNGYILDAMIGLQSIDPVGGVFDFNRPKMHLAGMNPGEDCKKHFAGIEEKPVENPQVQLSHFGGESAIEAFMRDTIFTIIQKIVTYADGTTGVEETKEYERENAHQQVILTKKERQPYQESNCDFSIKPCAGNMVGNYSKDLDKHGGFPAGFIADKKQEDVEAHATLYDKVTIVGFPAGNVEDFDLNANKMKHGFLTMACTGVPSNLQDKAIVGDKGASQKILEYCGEKEPGKCPIDLIEAGLAKSSGSCNLKNPGAYTSSNTYLTSLEKQALPSGVTPLMRKVLEAAGATYNVPASVLLGTMLEEGSFNHADVWSWTDENVRLYSDCTKKDPMPSCREFGSNTSEGATGPFGFISNWWNNYIETGGPFKAYESDPAWKEALTKAKPNYSECNFVDAAFTAARELGEDASHYQPAYVPPAPQSCTIDGSTYNTNISFIPASCSSWTADTVALARMQYGDRTCSADVGRMVRTYKGI